MRRVILESPFAGNWYQRLMNRVYARRCMKDCLRRGEAPFASHLLYTQVLNDQIELQREWGIAAGFAWLEIADASVVYVDRGISRGMQAGIDAARREGVLIEYRSLKNPDHDVSEQSARSGDFSRRGSSLDITLLFQHGKALPAGLMYRRVAGDVLPSGDRDIDIGWIDFDGEALSP